MELERNCVANVALYHREGRRRVGRGGGREEGGKDGRDRAPALVGIGGWLQVKGVFHTTGIQARVFFKT
jgi:hypothetical protein